jgi:very-short-patch-repair endonuclease
MKAVTRRPNKAECRLQHILNQHFPSEWKYTGPGDVVIGGLVPDFTNCNGRKQLIELFGEYWHDPKRTLRYNYTEEGRTEAYEAFGFECLVIWVREMKDEEKLVQKIKGFGAREHEKLNR